MSVRCLRGLLAAVCVVALWAGVASALEYRYDHSLPYEDSAAYRVFCDAVAPDGSYFLMSDTMSDLVLVISPDGDLVRVVGKTGTSAEKLHDPGPLAMDAAGNIYVTEPSNGLVKKYSSDGCLLTAWGGCGSDPGQFKSLYDIAVGPGNLVFVSDSGNHRIQVFDESGNYLTAVGGYGTSAGLFDTPRALDVSSLGELYVCDSGNERIQHFTVSGAAPAVSVTYAGQWSSYTTPGDMDPAGVWVDSDGLVYVTDVSRFQPGVHRFTSTGSYLGQWWSGYADNLVWDGDGAAYVSDAGHLAFLTGDGVLIKELSSLWSNDDILYLPRDVAVSPSGKVGVVEFLYNSFLKVYTAGVLPVVTDYRACYPDRVAMGPEEDFYVIEHYSPFEQRRVLHFAADGTYLNSVGFDGPDAEYCNYPLDVAVDRNNVVYMSCFHESIKTYTPDGTFLEEWGAESIQGDDFSPTRLAVDGQGDIWTWESFQGCLMEFANDGTFKRSVAWPQDEGGGPRDFAFDPRGRMVTLAGTETNPARLVVLTSDGNKLCEFGEQGAGPGQFDEPEGLGVDASGRVYIADTRNNRIQVLRPVKPCMAHCSIVSHLLLN